MTSNKQVKVIGAGIAGMAAAARLAAKGFKVMVFEKNDTPGGKLGLLQQDGFTFDTGPSLFTQPYILAALFKDCGADLTDYLQYRKLDINTHYFYADGTSILAYADRTALLQELGNKLNINTGVITHFLQDAGTAYEKIGSIFLDEPIHDISTWLSPRVPKAFSALKWNYLLQSMHNYHSSKLKDPKLVQLFDRLATYNGSNPYTAPAMLSMIAHLEMNEGAYYANGGMISISNAIYRLCKTLGVTFHFNTPVDKIIVNKQVEGVQAKGITYDADIVVSNSDVYFTYKNLLSDSAMANKIELQERSSSAVIFYWGIRQSFPQLGLHNIFFAEDYKAEFDSIFKTQTVYADPTVYINITSKMESTHAPSGCENWFVLINTPTAAHIGDEQVKQVRSFTISKLNHMMGIDVEQLIMTEKILDPTLIAAGTNSYKGALYGTASNNPMAAFMRHGNTSGKYKGLYFAGGTVHPGGGIPLCLRSARLATNAIMHQYS